MVKKLLGALLFISVTHLLATSVAAQQAVNGLAIPIVQSAVDSHGVNLLSGTTTLGGATVRIGTKDSGLQLSSSSLLSMFGGLKEFNIDSQNVGYSELAVGHYMTVGLGSYSEMFRLVGANYVRVGAKGSLTCTATTCQHTSSDGTVSSFDRNSGIWFMDARIGQVPFPEGSISQIVKPDGEIIKFNYVQDIPGASPTKTIVSSSLGWLIKLSLGYAQAIALNSSVEFCDFNSSCSTYNWPKYTESFTSVPGSYGNVATTTVTNNLGYSYITREIGTPPGTGYFTTTYTFPSGVTNSYNIGSCSSSDTGCNLSYFPTRDRIVSLTIGTSIFNYGYDDYEPSAPRGMGPTITTGPDGSIVSWGYSPKPVYSVDNLNRKTTYFYDANAAGFLSDVWDPDATPNIQNPTGGYTHYIYDVRGNITSVTVYPKNSGTPLVMSATYPEVGATTCSNPKTCNKPLTITDQAGVTTTYTYDPTHGGLTSETKPAVNGVQAQTRYGYEQKIPYVKNSSGALVANPSVWRLVSTSKCMTMTLNTCVGAADEQRTEFSDFTNNLLSKTTTIKLGNGSIVLSTTKDYDIYGNVTSVDGPRPGSYDTTYYFYDALRQKNGEIGTDPDGSGARLRQATRITYNGDGKVSSIEKGKVSGTTLSDLTNAMTVLDQQTTEYSTATGLPLVERYYAGGALQKVTQKSYNSDLRVECVAQRLNPAAFNSLPASACTLGTPGTEGGDRITKITYDATGAVLKTTSGYGTLLQRDDRVSTYNPTNGLLATEADGLGNTTTYQYDDFKRPFKTIYPTPGSGTTASTTDYTQTNYRTGSSLVDSVRLRDGLAISFGYDALGRTSTKSGAVSESFTYNNFNQVATHTNNTTGGASAISTYSFNSLGWLNSESRTAGGISLGVVSYLYDTYGRRNRLTWSDGFYVTYDYTVSGYAGDYLQAIKESSGATLASFAYDDYARRTSMTRGNGVVTSYGYYDNRSRLQTLATDVGGGTADDISESFGYTTSGQVKSRTLNVTNSNYIYAPAATGTTSYVPNALNQITTVTTGTAATLLYDGRGNLNKDNTTGTDFTYNADNLLLNATKAGVTTTLTYDAEKRLYSVTKSGATTKFAYDGTKLITETDGSNNVLRRYVPGPGTDEPIVWYEGSGTSDKRYPTTDRQGSIVGMTSASGTNLFINAYDEYGVPRAGNQGRFQYTGQTWLSDIGLYYYKARFYNPALGRFMQADPIGYKDGMNWYAYVVNDSVNRTDPTGTQCYSAYQNCYSVSYVSHEDKRPIPESLKQLEKVADAADNAGKVVNAANDTLATTANVAATVVQPGGAVLKTVGVAAVKNAVVLIAKVDKAFSLEKQALVAMAKADKKVGMTAEDMKAYKELNKGLPDPFPTNLVRGPEQHLDRAYNEVHGHVGPVDHIPIIDAL